MQFTYWYQQTKVKRLSKSLKDFGSTTSQTTTSSYIEVPLRVPVNDQALPARALLHARRD